MKTDDSNVITHDPPVAPDSAPVAPPCAIVIFGAAGDLTKRLVVPALYNLVGAQRLPDEFRIVGVDLTSKTTAEWRRGLTDTIQSFVGSDGESALDQLDSKAWQWLTDRMSYVQGDLTKRLVVPALYNLVGTRRLPNEFRIVGVDLASKTTEDWRTGLTDTIQSFVGSDAEFAVDQLDSKAWQWL